MGIHCLLPFLRKLKSVCGPVRLLLFLRDKFVVRRQLKRFRKNQNCSLAQESIHLAVVTRTADGCVNNIKFASYLTGNRPLTCKRIALRLTRRVAVCIVIHWSSDSFHCSNSTVLHSMIKVVD